MEISLSSFSSEALAYTTEILKNFEFYFLVGFVFYFCLNILLLLKLVLSYKKNKFMCINGCFNSSAFVIYLHLVVDALLCKIFSYLQPTLRLFNSYLKSTQTSSAYQDIIQSPSFINILRAMPKIHCVTAIFLTIIVILNLLNSSRRLKTLAISSIIITSFIRVLYIFNFWGGFSSVYYFFILSSVDICTVAVIIGEKLVRSNIKQS